MQDCIPKCLLLYNPFAGNEYENRIEGLFSNLLKICTNQGVTYTDFADLCNVLHLLDVTVLINMEILHVDRAMVFFPQTAGN